MMDSCESASRACPIGRCDPQKNNPIRKTDLEMVGLERGIEILGMNETSWSKCSEGRGGPEQSPEELQHLMVG